VLTLLLYGFGHGIGHTSKIGKSEFKTGTSDTEVLNAEEIDEVLQILEFFRLVDVDTES
jgi:hypothetical protein